MPTAVELTVKIVPPVPTFNPFPTVTIPAELLKTNFGDVAKSFDSLNKISPLFPGGETVILTFGAGVPSLFKNPTALIELPIRTN